MKRLLLLSLCAVVATPAVAQLRGAAGIEQVPAPRRSGAGIGVAPVGANRSSATAQSATAEKVPPAVAPEVVEACRRARAQDRPAPAGVDCIRALQVATPAARPAASPTAEISLLGLLGQSGDVLSTSPDGAAPASADDVARQLSAGEVQGDTAAAVARDRPAPQAPPPRR